MYVVVDRDECIGCGQCKMVCPDVFGLRADGLAYTTNDKPDNGLMPKVDQAIEECPSGAIAWKKQFLPVSEKGY